MVVFPCLYTQISTGTYSFSPAYSQHGNSGEARHIVELPTAHFGCLGLRSHVEEVLVSSVQTEHGYLKRVGSEVLRVWDLGGWNIYMYLLKTH